MGCLDDLVFEDLNIHFEVNVNLEGIKINISTLAGKGTPARQILGKSKLLLGLLEGIPTMQKGEISMVFFC